VLAGCSPGGSATPTATPTATPPADERATDRSVAAAAPTGASREAAQAAPPRASPLAAPSAGGPPAPPAVALPGAAGAPRLDGDARVLRVVEVALLDVLVAGDVYRVRLAGVGLPAVHGVLGCYAEEARVVTAGLAPAGSVLTLEAAPSGGDALPAVYAWSGGTLINERIVEQGYALVGEAGARGSHAVALLAAERSAARSIAGLWGAAVGNDAYRGTTRCESLSGYFSSSFVGLATDLIDGVPYSRSR
jgi:endonuclease YncB( thermonuclease family)